MCEFPPPIGKAAQASFLGSAPPWLCCWLSPSGRGGALLLKALLGASLLALRNWALRGCCWASLRPPACLPWQDLKAPAWKQWREFLLKYWLLPYQLIAEFAWDWLEVHYWTSRFIIVNAMLLSVLELCSLWTLWLRRELRCGGGALASWGGERSGSESGAWASAGGGGLL